MGQNIDDLLKQALTPTEEPDYWLNQKLINDGCKKGKMTMKKSRRLSFAVGAALFLGIGVTSVYAAHLFFTPQHVAEVIKDEKLAKAFQKKDAIEINETQKFKDYNVTLIGLVSGKNLTDYSSEANGEILIDRTYSVVAIENADGTEIVKDYNESGEVNFLVSPFLEGYNPVVINSFTLQGGYTEFVEDGVIYRLTECDNIEKFAKKTIYLGVMDSTFYNADAYNYDKESGKITRKEDYEGVNALFTLPIDKKKADSKAVKAFEEKMKQEGFLEDSGSRKQKEKVYFDDEGETVLREEGNTSQEEFVSKLTPENLHKYAKKVKGYDQVLEPKDGYISYTYQYKNGDSNANQQMEALFPDGKPGMSKSFSFSGWGDDLKSMVIESLTLQEDGKVLLELYRVK